MEQTTTLNLETRAVHSLSVNVIAADPEQPRKVFNQNDLEEIAFSIRELGLLQPIAVRPDGDGYIVIFGERRLKAALLAGLKEIPVIIHNVTAAQALDMQIVENLQRADLHPMQEAAGFLKLEARGMNVNQIAARVGKSVFYTRQRLKLNALSPAWQEIFTRDLIPTKTALLIGRLSEESQKALYKECVLKEGKEFYVNNLDWKYKQLSLLLQKACFALDDATLNPKMGACVGCPFNSATASLFEDDKEQPKCGNAPCYDLKTKVQIDRQLKIATDNPDILFVKTDHGHTPLYEKLEKKGKKIVDRHDWRNAEGKPEDLEKKFQEGKLAKALAVNGDNMGRFIYGTVVKSSSSSSGTKAKKPEKGAKISTHDCDIEIRRLQDGEKRKKELDQVKVHKGILEAVADNDAFKKPGLKMQPADRTIMVFLLLHEVSNSGNYGGTNFRQLIGLPEKPYGGESYHEKYFEKLSKVTDDQLALLIRSIVKHKYGHAATLQCISANDWPMLQIATYLGVDVKALQKAQGEVAATRIERVNNRIQQQRQLKKELHLDRALPKKAAAKKNAGERKPGAKTRKK